MADKGAQELLGLTAQEILQAHFRNELKEGAETESIVQAAEFLESQEFEVWEFRGASQEDTVWRDALDKFWRVYYETGDIVKAVEQ